MPLLINNIATFFAVSFLNLKLNQITENRSRLRYLAGSLFYYIASFFYLMYMPKINSTLNLMIAISVYLLIMFLVAGRNSFLSLYEYVYIMVISLFAQIISLTFYVNVLGNQLEKFYSSISANLGYPFVLFLCYTLAYKLFGRRVFGFRDFIFTRYRKIISFTGVYVFLLALWLIWTADIWASVVIVNGKNSLFYTIVISVMTVIFTIVGIVLVHMLVSIRRESILIEESAATDCLTGVLTRKYGMEYLNGRLKKSVEQLLVCFVDINNLKQVNDSLGHTFGDVMICQIASELRSVLKESEKIIRMGGDEFLLIFESRSLQEADELMQKILIQLEQKKPEVLGKFNVSFSYGIAEAEWNEKKRSMDELLKYADKKMYENKADRNNYIKK